MKHKSPLTSRFVQYRRAHLMAAAVLSVSALRTIQAHDDKDAGRRIAQIQRERLPAMDDSTDSADQYAINRAPDGMDERLTSTAALLLTKAERDAIRAARPAARSIVERKPVMTIEEPAPSGFVPEIAAYEPVYTPEEDALARAQAAFELDVESQPLMLTA